MIEDKQLEHSLDTVLRPKNWDDYIGQKNVKKNLKILIEAAKERNQMPEHILLYGSAGLGKTTLAYIISNMLNVPIQTTSGPTIERPGDIISLASTLEKGGVLFIDEIHGLNRAMEETLYPIMESGGISIIVGKGPTAQPVKIELPPIVIVAATTQVGKLSSPLRTRFSGGIMKLTHYTKEDLGEIIKKSAEILNIQIDDRSVEEIAKRSRQTPRTANGLLKWVRDYAQVKKLKITPDAVVLSLKEREIDEHGLTEEDRSVLKVMKNTFNGGPVGIQALATTMGEDTQTLEEVHEPFLIKLGLIERTPNGRSLTKEGENYLNSIK